MTRILLYLFLLSGVSSLFGASEIFEYKDIKTLRVDSSALDIEVLSGDSDLVIVELIDISDRVKVDLYQNGEELILESVIEKHFSFFYFRKNRVVFYVPQKTTIHIQSSAGDIKVQGLRSNHNEIISAAGDITLLNSSGDFTIKTSAGDQIVKRFSGIISSSSKAGDIIGRDIFISGDSLFSSTFGDISIDFNNNINDIYFITSSKVGDIRVKDSIGLGSNSSPFKVMGKSTIGDQTYR